MKRFFLTLLAFLPALLLSAQTEPPARGTHQLGSYVEAEPAEAPSPLSLSTAKPFSQGTLAKVAEGLPVRMAPAKAWQLTDITGARQLMANNHSTHVCYGGNASVDALGTDSVIINRFCFGDVSIRAKVDLSTGIVTIPTQFIDSVQGLPVYLCKMDFRSLVYDKTTPLRGHLYKGSIVIDDGFGFFVTEGPQAGAYLNIGLMDYAALAQPNAAITARRITFKDNTMTVANRQVTEQTSNGFAYPVSDGKLRLMRLPVTTSFSDIDLTLSPDGAIVIDPQAIANLSLYGDFYLYRLTETTEGQNVKFSVNVLNPVEASYTTGDKKLTWGTWGVARTNALLGTYEGTSVVLSDGITFPTAPTLNLEGQGTQESPWLIKTPADFEALRYDIVNNPTYRGTLTSDGNDHNYYPVYAGKYFKLANDIDFGTDAPGVEPIGNTQYWFAANFDGDGHTISNFYINNYAYDYAGLFGHLASGASVRNIKFAKPVVTSIGYTAGVLAGYSYAPVSDVTITDARVIVSAGYNAGTLVGYSSEPLTNITVTNSYVQGLGYLGGIAGRSYNNITNCHATGTVIQTGGQVFAGGLVGQQSKRTTASPAPVITGCSFTGTVQATGDEIGVGGLFGAFSYSKLNQSFASSSVFNSSSRSAYVGGLAGVTYEAEIDNCYAAGYVRNPESPLCGGLVGHNTQSLGTPVPTRISNSYSSVMLITKSTSSTRGITGDSVNFTVTNCLFDNQLTPAQGAQWGALTSTLTSGTLPAGFSADVWTAAAGCYPMLKNNSTVDAAKASVAAIVLPAEQNINDVQTNFTYAAPAGVTWAAMKNGELDTKGGYAFTFADGTGMLNYEQYTDTVFAQAGRAQRFWFLNIAPAPFDGKGTAAEPWQIKTREDLKKFSDMSNNARMSFTGRYLVLTADIDCQGDTLMPVCKDPSAKLVFEGNFNGQGHQIDNFHILAVGFFTEDNVSGTAVPGQVNPKDPNSYYFSGLFANVGKQGVISNLNIGPNADIESFQHGGAIAGGCEGLITNCRNYGRVRTYYSNAGGIVGNLKAGGIVRGCYNNGFIATNGNTAGGVVGVATQATVENCENTGTVKAYFFNPYQKEGNQYGAGGVVGYSDRSTLRNLVNSGFASSYKQVGGIVSKISATAALPAHTEACVNYGLVESTVEQTSVGSIAGLNTLGTFAGCMADKQLQKVGTVSNGLCEGTQMLPTLSLASAQGYPAQYLADSVWSLTNGKYPTMKYSGTAPTQSTLNATAVIRFPANDFAQAMVADAPLSSGVNWSLVNNAVFSIANNTLKVLVPSAGCFTDTIVATLDGNTRRIPLATLNAALTEGEGTFNKPFLIRETSEWLAVARFMKQWNYDYQGQYFKLMNDLDFKNDDFLPLGNGVQFNGSFDGNGKKLLNVNYIGSSTDKTSVNYGLFGTLGYDGMVSDLTLASGTISCFQCAGGIAAISYGNIVNCTNSAAVSTLANSYAGGIAGYAYPGAQFLNCRNNGQITSKTTYGAGIVGYAPAGSKLVITDCVNDGVISGTSKIGGICGGASATLTNCRNSGQVSTTATGTYAAGIIAEALVPSSITGSSNSGEVHANQYAAGIVALTVAHTAATPFRVDNCFNTADLTSGAKGYLGGIGCQVKAGAQITNCYNTGTMTGTKTSQMRMAGIVADIASTAGARSRIENCFNTADIESWSNTGGIAGGSSGDSLIITNCHNTGNVKAYFTSAGNAGGILGNGAAEITNCWNSGNIVSLGTQAGGINGTNTSKGMRIWRCVNLGNVEAAKNNAGGMIGLGRATMTDCYNMGSIKAPTAVGGLFGQPGPAAAASYTTTVDRCYNAGKIIPGSDDANWGNIMGQNTSCKYLVIRTVYADTDTTALSAYDNTINVQGRSTRQLMSTDMGDCFSLIPYTFPTLKIFAANDTLNLAAATVLPSEGETLNAVKTRVYLSMPQGASWTSSTDMLRINGDHATNKSLQDNLAATLTLKLGSLTRTFALNLMKSNSIDGLDTDAKPVAGYEYYRLDGTRTNADDNAPVLLRRTVYTDGTFTVAKIVNRR